MVDQALAEINWDIGAMNNLASDNLLQTTAGIYSAHADYTLVRKFTIKEGETNWDLARGSNW